MLARAVGRTSKVVLLTALAMIATASAVAQAPLVNKRLEAAAQAVSQKSLTPRTALDTLLPDYMFNRTADGVMVEVLLDRADGSTASALTVPGASVKHVSTTYRRATLEVTDPAAIRALVQVPGVRMIFPVAKSRTRYWAGAARSEAVQAMRSDTGGTTWRAQGQGQKVGVLSDSFAVTSGVRDGNTSPGPGQPGILTGAKNQDSGDLPAQVEILADSLGNDEGAAMAELIHDVAPAAAIAFHTANGGEAVFADGINRLRAAGSTVIVDDVGYFAEPVYQPGIVEQAAADAVAAGVPYFSSAGNDGNKALSFIFQDIDPARDSEAFPPDGVDFHRWPNGTAYLPVTVYPGTFLQVTLQWNQPFQSVGGKGAEVDMDLYLAQEPTVAFVAREARPDGFSSTEQQGRTGQGLGDAVEITGIVNAGFAPLTAYLVVEHVHGEQDFIPQDPSLPLECRLSFFGGRFRVEGISSDTDDTGSPAISGHNVAEGAVSVGAIPWYDTPRFDVRFGPTHEIDPEDFSSLGGTTRQYFDRAGNLSIRTIQSPTLAAPDGNDTTFFIGGSVDLGGYDGEPDQFPNFFGTSASAPNAAAVAAQMKSLDPTLGPAEITEIMTSTAIDVKGRRAAEGWDNTTGAGLIDAQAALEEVARRAGIGLPGATATPVVTVIPSPTPTPLPVAQQAFDFTASAEGWTAATIPDFSPAPGRYENGSLVLSTPTNVNAYGFFQSPWFIAGNWREPGGYPITGVTGTDSLFRATLNVRSNQLTETGVPSIRLRASVQDFSQTAEMTVTSNVANGLPPTLEGQTLRHYFALPSGKDRFRLFIDVLSFGGTDVAGAEVLVDRVVVEGLSVPSLGFGRVEKEFAFGGNTLGWTFREAAPFGKPVSTGTADGLRIGPTINPGNNTFFGYWGSPGTEANPVRIDGDRVYRLRWRVGSNATEGQRIAVPAFRLRVNDASLNFSTLVNVDSINASSPVPMGAQDREYSLFFEGREELESNRLLYSFDYILVPAAGNDPSVLLTLENLRVDSFDKPVF